MESRPIQPRARNKHHPVGESLLGAKKFSINKHEHAAFHRACGYSAPDMLARRLVYAGFTKNSYSIPLETAQSILDVLSPEQWRDIYEPDTFMELDLQTLPHRDRAALASYHMRNFFQAEQRDIQYAMGRTAGMEEPQPMKDVMMFFRTNSAPLALKKLFSETAGRSQNHRLKWAETVHSDKWKSVMEDVSTMQMQKISQETREDVLELLQDQSDKVHHWMKNTFPKLEDFTPELARMGSRGKIDMSDID